MKAGQSKRVRGLRPIYPGVLYPLEDFVRRVGTGKDSIHQLHASGDLRLKLTGKTYWIYGQDWIDFAKRRDAVSRRDRGPRRPTDEGEANMHTGEHDGEREFDADSPSG